MWWWIAFAGTAESVMAGGPRLTATLDPVSRRVEIIATGLGAGDYELRIETPGLLHCETGRDVNEPGVLYLPPRETRSGETPPADVPAENLFFFNDFTVADGWELTAKFAPAATGTWKLNGRFSKLGGTIRSELRIPVAELEQGENLLHYAATKLDAPALSWRRRVPAGETFVCALTVGHADWRGEVALVSRGDGWSVPPAAIVAVAGPPFMRRAVTVADSWERDRSALTDGALAVGRNVLHAQVTDPRSVLCGGFNLVYDVEHGSYRMPHWIWAWGPAIKLLLDLERLSAAKEAGLASHFHTAALGAGRRSLAFGATDPKHPAFGVSTVRWEPSRAVPGGWVEYISTADSLFLAGWGWMSLYGETGEAEYRERTQTLVAAAGRLMNQYPVVPQDWVVQRDRWTPHTLDESVFGTIGFRRLFEATHDASVAAEGRRFLDSHLTHMGRESGLLQRAWMRDEARGMWDPDIKGHAWVLEGYLDAYRLSGEPKYLDLALTLTARVLSCQREDGAWTYLFQKPVPGAPEDDKAIAIWAYLLYDLHRVTKDPVHLAAARRALGWCLRHQWRGDDPYLDGAILNTSAMAYVRRRPMTILYTTTFFGLALLEELALTEKQ
jgi:hypothetical protein